MHSGNDFCWIFVDEDRPSDGLFQVQFQFFGLLRTLNVIATDMSFVQRIIDFVTETRDRPELRDIPLGGGVYRQVWQDLELSASFWKTRVSLMKYGEYDDHYVLAFGCPSALGGLGLSLVLYGKRVDGFLDALSDVLEVL